MEIFDIVDELGNPTGETVERSEAHEKGIRHRTAHIWLTRREGGISQVLLQKRAMTKDSFPGCFDTSSAGHIGAGDEPLEAALRELSEELGIRATAEELKFITTFRIEFQKEFNGKMFCDDEVAFVYVYDRSVEIGDIVVQKEELDGVEWFDVAYVERMLKEKNPDFCVPPGGFAVIKRWCEEN